MPFRMLWWALAWQVALYDKPAWHGYVAGVLTYMAVFWHEYGEAK